VRTLGVIVLQILAVEQVEVLAHVTLSLVLHGIIRDARGDTDLNNVIDGRDCARVDATFNNETSTQTDIGGWFNGDFDGNGKVDGADYALIDSCFNFQGNPGAVIPEPTACPLVATSLIAGLWLRTRRQT
jgi:hypothetical protein